MDTHNILECDVLIIGSGVAGSVAALQLADAGIDVVVVTRSSTPEESNTRYAQGGIIYTGPEDSPKLLAEDITRAPVTATRGLWKFLQPKDRNSSNRYFSIK